LRNNKLEGEKEISKSGVHSVSRLIDKETISCLENMLSYGKLIDPDLKAGDTFPNIDGNITVLKSVGGEPVGRFEVQVKKIVRKKKMISYSLEDSFISYAQDNPDNPPLLIVVDTEQFVAYWAEMNSRTLSKINGNTIQLNPNNEISKNSISYYNRWKKILLRRKVLPFLSLWKVNHYLGVYEIDFIRRNYSDLQGTISRTLGSSDAEKFKEYIFPEQFKVQGIIDDTSIARVSKKFVSKIKKEYLLPLLDFAFPVFSDGRGKQKKAIISKVLRISEKTEEKMIDELIAEKKLSINENLYITPDANEVKIIQSKMIDEGIISVEDLINLFTNEGYE
jgi:hypothetical protein